MVLIVVRCHRFACSPCSACKSCSLNSYLCSGPLCCCMMLVGMRRACGHLVWHTVWIQWTGFGSERGIFHFFDDSTCNNKRLFMVPHLIRTRVLAKTYGYAHFITHTYTLFPLSLSLSPSLSAPPPLHTHTLQIHVLLVMGWYSKKTPHRSVCRREEIGFQFWLKIVETNAWQRKKVVRTYQCLLQCQLSCLRSTALTKIVEQLITLMSTFWWEDQANDMETHAIK